MVYHRDWMSYNWKKPIPLVTLTDNTLPIDRAYTKSLKVSYLRPLRWIISLIYLKNKGGKFFGNYLNLRVGCLFKRSKLDLRKLEEVWKFHIFANIWYESLSQIKSLKTTSWSSLKTYHTWVDSYALRFL